MIESKQNRYGWLPEWQKKIIRKYPLLYLEPSPKNLNDCECQAEQLPEDFCNLRYGFECEAGWAQLLDELSDTGTALIKALRAFGFQCDARIFAFIVKEKFGVLCWQGDDNLLPPFHSLWFGYFLWIRERSSCICERSGKFGELRDIEGWLQTLSQPEYDNALKRKSEKRPCRGPEQ